MERQSLSTYTMGAVEPFVADAFHLLTQRYTCGSMWEGPKFDNFGCRRIVAQPISPSRIYKSVISMSAKLDVALGEYTCKIYGGAKHPRFAVYPGKKRGEVRLRAGVDVEFKVYQGRSDTIELTNGDTVNGIVCPAQEYHLSDDTTCVRLETRAGNIWLRSKPKNWGRLGRMLFLENQTDGVGHETVVELAEWSFDQDIKEPWSINSTPWKGLQTSDTSGRPWVVTESELKFSADMRRLSLDDGDVERFRGKPRLKLEPPYGVVWQPTFDTYVPLSEY